MPTEAVPRAQKRAPHPLRSRRARRADGGRPGRGDAVIATGYLLAAISLTWPLWLHPATTEIAGNPHDADQFSWFLAYSAHAVSGGHLPGLVTHVMNLPRGINLAWNTSVLLPGVLLTPVTRAFGPQTSLNLLTLFGFAGSAFSMYAVTRRWVQGRFPAVLAGAIYGYSPALLHAAIGHTSLQLAILPPLIIDRAVLLCVRRRPLRDGAILGALMSAQLYTGEELLCMAVIAAVVMAIVLAISRPRLASAQARPATVGAAVAVGITMICGAPLLWTQFVGPLAQHGSAFTVDFFKTDLTGFTTPDRHMLLHTAGSAAAASAYGGGDPEYLAYLGWPLIAVTTIGVISYWRVLAIRAATCTGLVLAVFSLGQQPLIAGQPADLTLPWHWLAGLPALDAALVNRFSILIAGFAGLACAGVLRELNRAQPYGAVTAAITLAVLLPLAPHSLAGAPTPPRPTALVTAPTGRVLVLPFPTATLTYPLRWQAVAQFRFTMPGGYFTGPAWDGHAYIDGDGFPSITDTVDRLAATGHSIAPTPSDRALLLRALRQWQVHAVVIGPCPGQAALTRFVAAILGPATTTSANPTWDLDTRPSPNGPRIRHGSSA
jgi:hypothetical protein